MIDILTKNLPILVVLCPLITSLFVVLIPNIFFSAAGSHPGAGLPGVLSSAKVVENILKKRYGVK